MHTGPLFRTTRLAAVLLTVALIHTVVSAQSKVGTTAAQFLGISVGAQAIGMGGAYVASLTDVTSLYWNPGAMAQAEKTQFSFTNTEWIVRHKIPLVRIHV